MSTTTYYNQNGNTDNGAGGDALSYNGAPPVLPTPPPAYTPPAAPVVNPYAQYAYGRAPDSPLNKYNTQTGALNPNYQGDGGGSSGGSTGGAGTGGNTGAPADSAAGIMGGYQLTLTPDQIAQQKAQADWLVLNGGDANQTIDPNAIYQQKLKESQAQIDAVNAMYADQLTRARAQGTGRIATNSYGQAAAGLAGSGAGQAQTNVIQDANTAEQAAIDNERQAAVQAILTGVRNSAATDLATKTAAKKAGADALLQYYKDKPAQKTAALQPVIATLISKGIDPSTLSASDLASITDGLGVSKDDVISAYTDAKTAKATSDAAAAKSAADLASTTASTEQTQKETELLGKMTDYQKAQLAQDESQFGRTQALAKWTTIFNNENKTVTNPQVQQYINTQMATPEFKAMTDSQKSDFILANGGTPSDYGY